MQAFSSDVCAPFLFLSFVWCSTISLPLFLFPLYIQTLIFLYHWVTVVILFTIASSCYQKSKSNVLGVCAQNLNARYFHGGLHLILGCCGSASIVFLPNVLQSQSLFLMILVSVFINIYVCMFVCLYVCMFVCV